MQSIAIKSAGSVRACPAVVRIAVLAALCVGLLPLRGAAAETPSAVVHRLIDSMKKLGSAGDCGQKTRVVESVNQTLAIGVLARDALGPAWTRLDRRERKRFVSLLTQVLEKVAYPRAMDFFAGLEVIYRGEDRDGTRRIVRTAVTRPDSGEVRIDYLLARIEGRWQIVDVVLDRQSLADGVRDHFQKLLKEGSYEDLVKRLKARLDRAANVSFYAYCLGDEPRRLRFPIRSAVCCNGVAWAGRLRTGRSASRPTLTCLTDWSNN